MLQEVAKDLTDALKEKRCEMPALYQNLGLRS